MLVIICWNIKQITSEKAREFGADVMRVLSEYSRDTPVIAFILENKTEPREVIQYFKKSEAGSRFDYVHLDLGGSKNRRENIIVAYRNIERVKLERYTGWVKDWNQRTQALFAEELQRDLDLYALQLQRSGRRQDPVCRVPEPFPAPEDFRMPLLVRLCMNDREYAIVAMHAPGPRDGAKREYTKLYMQAVLSTLPPWVTVVVGDMNLYCSTPEKTGFWDLSQLSGGTTLSESFEQTSSRLDRVLVRPAVSGAIKLFEPFSDKSDTSTCFSDHFGIGCSIRWMPDIASIQGPSLIPWTLAEKKKEYEEMDWETTQLKRALGKKGEELGQRLKKQAERMIEETTAWTKSWMQGSGFDELPCEDVQYRTCDYITFSYGKAITLPEGWTLGHASGEENNCLIDTLVQLVARDITDRRAFVQWIRTQLKIRYGVSTEGYLMAGVHSIPILRIIASAGIPIDPDAYSVHAIAVVNDVQIEETNGSGGTDLFLFCDGDHYDPIFQS
ncbi:MAG: hypothetical protein DIU78_021095 [Pseudomonadota bacterium]